MVEAETHDVTQLLIDWSNGDKTALDKLVPIVDQELRRLAHQRVALGAALRAVARARSARRVASVAARPGADRRRTAGRHTVAVSSPLPADGHSPPRVHVGRSDAVAVICVAGRAGLLTVRLATHEFIPFSRENAGGIERSIRCPI